VFCTLGHEVRLGSECADLVGGQRDADHLLGADSASYVGHAVDLHPALQQVELLHHLLDLDRHQPDLHVALLGHVRDFIHQCDCHRGALALGRAHEWACADLHRRLRQSNSGLYIERGEAGQGGGRGQHLDPRCNRGRIGLV